VTAALITDASKVTAATAAVTINDAAGTAVTAADLSAIGAATTGAVTVANAVAISGTRAEVTAALITDASKVTAATAAVTINDAAGTAVTAADLSAIGAATTGAVTVANAVAISGTRAEVTAALITDASKVTAATAAVTINDAAGTAVTAADLSAIGAATTGAVTVANAVAISGTRAEVTAALITDASKVTAATAAVTVTDAGSIAQITAIDDATTGNVSYSLSDTTVNINNASGALLKGAGTIAINDDAGIEGSTLDLNNVKIDNIGSIASVAITGDTGSNLVQLSTALTNSRAVSASFGSDNVADTLIFNVGDSSTYTSYNANGTVATGPSTFAFNKVSGFDLVGSEDKFGIFYGGMNLVRTFTELTDLTQASGYRLTDGKVYEDMTVAVGISYDNARSATFIADSIAFVINQGGVAAPGSVGKSGATDFVYVAYGESSSDNQKTSAYVYSAYYTTSGTVAGNSFASANLKVAALAEIFDVTAGDLVGLSSVATSKPNGLT
ncbi:hypothetical protein KBZ14_15020, partial [Synechococcus sp. HJ21-Hayes]|uniref:beta strand repeat-containing protein n=1 Tax=Synechococcus sp. HJ21-Hayes TaxID=2823736 RepID=UPI0020CFA21C